MLIFGGHAVLMFMCAGVFTKKYLAKDGCGPVRFGSHRFIVQVGTSKKQPDKAGRACRFSQSASCFQQQPTLFDK